MSSKVASANHVVKSLAAAWINDNYPEGQSTMRLKCNSVSFWCTFSGRHLQCWRNVIKVWQSLTTLYSRFEASWQYNLPRAERWDKFHQTYITFLCLYSSAVLRCTEDRVIRMSVRNMRASRVNCDVLPHFSPLDRSLGRPSLARRDGAKRKRAFNARRISSVRSRTDT